MSAPRRIARIFAPLLLLALAACGNDPARDADGPGIWQGVQAALRPGERPPPVTAAALKATLTPDRMARLNRPVLLTEIPGRGAARMLAVARNGEVTTWQSADGIALSLRGGLVISSRGFGADLMSADVGAVRAALAAGGGTARRTHTYLDGENRTRRLDLSCRIAPMGGGALRETCTGPGDLRVDNRYRLDGRGGIVQSAQWLGPGIGTMRLERIDP